MTFYSGRNVYEPRGWTLKDGSTYRDVYAAGVVIVQAYLSRQVYVSVDYNARLRQLAKSLVMDMTTDKHIINIIRSTILEEPNKDKMTMKELDFEV